MRPCRATRAGTQAPPLPTSIIFFHAIPHKQNSVHAQFTPNEINRPTRKIHALCAGDERRMRPCRATRAGTQAPPLPNSVIHLHTHRGRKCIAHSRPHFQNKKVCVCYDLGITVDDVLYFKTNYSLGITMDEAICFKTSYDLGVTVASP